MNKRVSTIVVTFNGENWVEKCLNSLQDSDLKTEVIVVDNASSDGTVEIVKKQYPNVKLLAQATNLGFGKANNLGVREALEGGADFVFLLNQDASVKLDTLTTLVSSIDQNPAFGIMSPIHFNGSGSALDERFSHYIAPQYCQGLYSDLFVSRASLKASYEAFFINAAAWLMPTATLEKVGGFNPLFHHYGEDYNYVHRLRFHGLKIGVCPQAEIFHDRTSSVIENLSKDQHSIQKLTALLDINKPNRVEKELRKARLEIFKSLVRAKPSVASRGLKYLNSLKENLEQINASRKYTTKAQKSYLDKESKNVKPIQFYIP